MRLRGFDQGQTVDGGVHIPNHLFKTVLKLARIAVASSVAAALVKRKLCLDNTTYMLYFFHMNAKQLMGILKKNGWKLDRINGSHHVFTKEGCRSVAVPLHGNRDIGNLARRILKEAGIE